MRGQTSSMNKNIELIIHNNSCCGCGVCENVCPTGAIAMVPDKEGFQYPSINNDACINCNKCERHCPIINSRSITQDTHSLACYGGYVNDKDLLMKSSSGGIASAISTEFILKGGIVCGVGYDGAIYRVKHMIASTIPELDLFKTSKYIQSHKGKIYKEVKEALGSKSVLYIGTPCEVAALKHYLGKEYDNLYTCDLICHGPTSGTLQKQYIEELEKQYNSKVVKFAFRSKKTGWTTPRVNVVFENGEEILEDLFSNVYGLAFMSLIRKSCHNCSYKGDNKLADITLGDFWGAVPTDAFWNENGTSAIMVHTKKGEELLSSCKDLSLFPTEYARISAGNPLLTRNAHIMKNRITYSRMYIKHGPHYAFKHKKGPVSTVERILRKLKLLGRI